MDDTFNTFDCATDCAEIRQIGRNERFAWQKIGRCLEIAEDQFRIERPQQLAQTRPDAAACARQKNFPHVITLRDDRRVRA
jgi:hypothetical protein